jgi:hypothetical protein
MLDAAVDEQQTIALRIEGVLFVLEALTVEAKELASLTEDRSELVHDTALHTAVVVLGSLTDLRHVPLREAEREEIIKCEGEGALQRSRRRHPCAQRYIACEDRVEASDLAATLLDLTAYAEDVACPRLAGGILFLETELSGFAEVECESTDAVRTIGADLSDHSLVDSAGEDEGAVVVGVLTDEVDTARRRVEGTGFAVERCELVADSLCIHLSDGLDRSEYE